MRGGIARPWPVDRDLSGDGLEVEVLLNDRLDLDAELFREVGEAVCARQVERLCEECCSENALGISCRFAPELDLTYTQPSSRIGRGQRYLELYCRLDVVRLGAVDRLGLLDQGEESLGVAVAADLRGLGEG